MTGASAATVTRAGANPFVGPRPIDIGQKIFGRDREIDKLYYLLSAERIVLFHSPSGAGKSSLIQAGLVKRLEELFDVWGPTRVNLPLPEGESAGVNRYVRSANLGFEARIPKQRQRLPEVLSPHTLSEYVAGRPRRLSAPKNIVLIFDQFEEILTVDPLAQEAKREFFDQIGRLLQDPHVWALFAMREDYMAPLDPYAEQVPTHLKNRFRLDLLGRDAAREAISRSVEEGGRDIARNAVERLVNDLATMLVQRPDGTFESQTGPYVEPLQLQVACRGLWERLPADRRTIDLEDIESFGDVTKALAEYYEREVAGIAGGDTRVERALREWVGRKLITPDGIRGQVLKGAGESEGLENELIGRLVDTHLVRGEQRAGATWYELSHDRLLKPVQDDNKEWFEKNLDLVQKKAALWHDQGEPEGLLLVGDELAIAQQWAQQNGAGASLNETRFLEACQRKQQEIDQKRRNARRMRVALVAVAVLAIVAIGGLVFAYRELAAANESARKAQRSAVAEKHSAKIADDAKKVAETAKSAAVTAQGEAEQKARVALEAKKNALAANSDRDEVMRLQRSANQVGSKPQLNLLLSVHGSSLLRKLEKGEFPAIDLLRHQLQASGGRPLIGHKEAARAAAFSPDQRWLATSSEDGEIRLWDLNDADPGGRSIRIGAHEKQVHKPDFAADATLSPHLAFSPDGKWLVSGGDDGVVRLWRLTTEGAEPVNSAKPDYGAIRSLTISPNGEWVAFGTETGKVCVWQLSSEGMRQTPCKLGSSRQPVSKVLFSSQNRWLASANIHGNVSVATNEPIDLWDTKSDFPNQSPKTLRFGPSSTNPRGNDENRLLDFAFSRDETLLAVTYSYRAQVWDLRTQNPPQNVVGKATSDGWIGTVGLSFDNRWLVTMGGMLWDFKSGATEPLLLEGRRSTSGMVLSDAGRWLATPQEDGVHLYDLASPSIGLAALLSGQDRPRVQDIVFSAGTDPRYVLGLEDLHPRLWSIPDSTSDPIVLRAHKGPTSAAMSGDGEWIASSGRDDHKLLVRNLKKPRVATQTRQLPAGAEVTITPNGRYLATRDIETGKVSLFTFPDLVPRELLQDGGGNVFEYGGSFGFTPDSRWLVSGYWDASKIALWGISDDNKRSLACQTENPVRALAFSADGRYVIAGINGSVAYVWDLHAHDPCASRFSLGPHQDAVEGVAISRDSRWAATASFDQHGRLWDLRSCQLTTGCQPVADVHFLGRSTRVAFSPDSQSVAFSSLDGTVQLLNLGRSYPWKPLVFKGHTNSVAELSFSRDSRWLISAGGDNTIRLWDRSDPELAPVILQSDARVRFMGFSKDGRKLISTGDDGTIRIWRLMYDDLVELACQTAGRQFSAQEVKDYLGNDDHDKATCANQPKLKE